MLLNFVQRMNMDLSCLWGTKSPKKTICSIRACEVAANPNTWILKQLEKGIKMTVSLNIKP